MKKESLISAVVKETHRIEEDSVHSMKGHFNAGSCWSRTHLSLGVCGTVLAASAGIWRLFFDYPEMITILAFLAAALTSVMTFLGPQQVAKNHKNAGREYNVLKNRARRFREIELPQLEDNEIVEKIKELAGKRDELNSMSPDIPRWAYEKAKKDIDDEKHKYQIDAKRNDDG